MVRRGIGTDWLGGAGLGVVWLARQRIDKETEMERRTFIAAIIAVFSFLATPFASAGRLFTSGPKSKSGTVNDYFSVGPHAVHRQRVFSRGVLRRERWFVDGHGIDCWNYQKHCVGTTFCGEWRIYDADVVYGTTVSIDPTAGVYLIVDFVEEPLRFGCGVESTESGYEVVAVHTGIEYRSPTNTERIDAERWAELNS